MSRSKWRGHDIECVNNVWIYSDNKKPVSENKSRPCGHCGRPQTKEGHDGCLGTLEGVMNACCGHGSIDEAYIQYENDEELRGKEALSEMSRDLTKEEKSAIRRLNSLAKVWPDSLWLFSANGSLCVMGKDDKNNKVFLPNDCADEEYIIEIISGIENDGGDW